MAVQLNPQAPPFHATSYSYHPPPPPPPPPYYSSLAPLPFAATYYCPLATPHHYYPLPPPPPPPPPSPPANYVRPPHKLISNGGVAKASKMPQAAPRGRSNGRPQTGVAPRTRSPSPLFTTRLAAYPPRPAAAEGLGRFTTVMVRNIPNKFSRGMMVHLLDNHCARMNKAAAVADGRAALSEYDFLYVPMDFRNRCNLGYAFVNFTTAEAARRLYGFLHRCQWKVFGSKKVIHVCAARIQGKGALVRHFKDSKFACHTADFLPAVFSPPRNGTTAFPRPAVIGNLMIK